MAWSRARRRITLHWFLSRVHPEDRARTQREVGKVVKTGGSFAYPERIIRPDGSVRDLETVGEAVCGEGGRVVALVGTCRDVTEERQRAELLRIHEEIIEKVQIALGVFEASDPNDVSTMLLVAANPAADSIDPPSARAAAREAAARHRPYAAGGELERTVTGVARDGHARDATVLRSRHPTTPIARWR